MRPPISRVPVLETGVPSGSVAAMKCVMAWMLTACCVAAGVVEVKVDTSEAPECAEWAAKAKGIAEEWAPKVHGILYGEDVEMAGREITLKFAPMKGVAHASGNGIKISAEWVTKKAPNDYGMVVHELVHVLQNYRGKGEFWVTEGIADYIRYEHYEPGKQKWKLQPGKSSYKQGYGIAGAFLAWLEKNKDPEIIRKLNRASKEGSYKPEMFKESCGAELDALWDEYVKETVKE